MTQIIFKKNTVFKVHFQQHSELFLFMCTINVRGKWKEREKKFIFCHLSSKTYPAVHTAEQMLSEEQTMNASSLSILDQNPENPQPPASHQCQPNMKKRVEKKVKDKEKHLSSYVLPEAALVMYCGPLVVTSGSLHSSHSVYYDYLKTLTQIRII